MNPRWLRAFGTESRGKSSEESHRCSQKSTKESVMKNQSLRHSASLCGSPLSRTGSGTSSERERASWSTARSGAPRRFRDRSANSSNARNEKCAVFRQRLKERNNGEAGTTSPLIMVRPHSCWSAVVRDSFVAHLIEHFADSAMNPRWVRAFGTESKGKSSAESHRCSQKSTKGSTVKNQYLRQSASLGGSSFSRTGSGTCRFRDAGHRSVVDLQLFDCRHPCLLWYRAAEVYGQSVRSSWDWETSQLQRARSTERGYIRRGRGRHGAVRREAQRHAVFGTGPQIPATREMRSAPSSDGGYKRERSRRP
jgi:hypothetical protein